MSRTRIVFSIALIAFLSTSSAFAQVAEQFRIGALRMSYVAQNSKAGKAGLAVIEETARKRSLELETRAAELQKQKTQRDYDKSRLELERFQQDAEAEIESMQLKFDNEFRIKLTPIIDAISKEKGLHFVFGLEQAAIVWWSPAVDISDEVVKRLDAAK